MSRLDTNLVIRAALLTILTSDDQQAAIRAAKALLRYRVKFSAGFLSASFDWRSGRNVPMIVGAEMAYVYDTPEEARRAGEAAAFGPFSVDAFIL